MGGIGIIGCGIIGKSRHIPALKSVSDLFTCKVVCDIRAENAKWGAEQLGCDWETDWRKVVGRQDVEAVALLTPPAVRREIIEPVCEAGKALYCEKPLALSLADAEAIRKRVTKSGIVFMTEFVRRFFKTTEQYLELRRTTFSEPKILLASTFEKPIRGTWGEWMQDGTRSGGHIMDFGIHLVDFCRFIFGVEATSVQGFGGHYVNKTINCNDYESLTIEFGEDRMAHVEVSRGFKDNWQVGKEHPFFPPFRILTESELIDLYFGSAITWSDATGTHRVETKQPEPIGTVMYRRFHAAIREGGPSGADVEDAYRATRIVLMGTESARQGKRLRL